ncbi:DUF1542 domain-containing protein [Streptococcus suis]|uniref:DUF1542 domain-containing protein n=1 Tax=Streptococcus suis TaxID=1307 RepID=UPI002AB5D686|nr:DUF1542 domain-containing protein [Streptococcus suis]MDY7593752.1 DUF1542 domain-containing protein [Streptococcus suis]
MSSKDMFRKEQRFSFRKFSFGLASAVIANVIFGGAITSSPVVHANTATETAAVATSERIASIPYTVNIVDQAGKVVETKEKKVSVYTVETIATATDYLTADLVPEGYAIVSGLGEVTLTEKADNIFTVKVDKIAPEAAAPTTTAESATSETSTAAATPEPASLTAMQPTPVTSEVAEAEVASTTSEESAKPTERTAYLSYITHYVNEANETVDRTGHLVAVKTTDETAKTQVTVSASENMPSGYELVQDKAKVVVQLVENQTNILVFAVTKKSKEEEISESQLSNRDVLTQVTSEADLLADEALRQVAKEQAGNTELATAANNTKAAATEAELGAQIDTVRTSTQNLAAEMLKVDKDGILTAMLDATTQAITITTSSKGAVRPIYSEHIRDFATNNNQRSYDGQDFFFGLIGKELTEQDSQISATAQDSDGSNLSISLVDGGQQPLTDQNRFGLQINNSGVIYGTTTIKDAGNTVSWQFKASSNGNGAVSKFTFVPYTVIKTDNEPIRKRVQDGVTADEILAKVKSNVTRGDGSKQGPLNATFEEYFNTTLTARATGKSTTVTEDAKNGKQIWHEIVGEIPTTAGEHTVTVRSTNVHGQTIDTQVVVDLYDFEAKDRAEVRKYTDFDKPIHAIIQIGQTGEEAAVVLENIPDDFQIENFNITDEAATQLANRNLEFVKNPQVVDKEDTVDNKKDGIVGYIRPKAEYGNVATYTGSTSLTYTFKYTNLNNATTDEENDVLSYVILFIDTKVPVITPKSEYIRFVGESYTISVPGTDNAYLDTGKIDGTLSVLKDGETGKVSPDLGTNTAIASEVDPTGKGNQGDSSTKFNVNITGTAPSAEGTGTYKLRVGENNYPVGPEAERVDGKNPENVGLTDIKVTFVKRAAMTTPVAVVDPANLTADEKAVVIAQLKKDNADNKRLQDLPDTAFTVNPDGTVSVDYSGSDATIDAVTDTVVNATVKLADEQKKAKDAIDTKLAEEKAAIEAKRDEAIAEINNTPGLTDDQKKAATDAVTNTANDALTALDTAADDAKKAIDTKTTVADINDAKTAGEKALDDGKAAGEAAIDLTKDKELAKADVDNQAAAAIEAIKNNPNLNEDEQAPYIDAIEKAAEEQKAAIDKAKDTAGITDAVNAAEKVNEEQKLAAAKEDAKDKIAEEVAAAKDAIDKNPNLSDAEKQAAKDSVDAEVAKANDAIDKAKTPAEAQTAEDNGVKAIDAEELAAAKQDAKNKIAKDVEAANAAIELNPNLSEKEIADAKAEVAKAAEDANKAIDAAKTPEAAQAAEEAGTKAIAEDVLDAAKQDAKNKIAKDLATVESAIDANSNLSQDEKDAAKLAAQAKEAEAVANIEKATTPEAAQTLEDAAVKDLANIEIKAAYDDAVKAIEAADNLSTAAKTQALEDLKKARQAAEEAIKTATTADEVAKGALDGLKSLAKVEAKAAADDAKAAIAQNSNLTDAEKKVYTDAIDKALKDTETKIDVATDADTVDAETVLAQKDIAKQEVAAATADAVKGIEANKAIDGSTSSVEVQAAKDKGNAAIAENVLDAAKQGAKNKLMEEADKAKAAIDANPNLTPEEKAAAKAEIDKAVEEAIISINGAGTHHALGEIKLPLSALIKPVVTVTPVLDPNNLTEEEIARIKALLEENNTFPEGTEIIVSKDASVSIKYPDGTIDLVLPAEIVKQADTTAPAITDDAKGNIVVAPTKEAVEFVVTYVDNNGKAQLVVVTKGADGKWTTTAKAVIVDPVTGQVIIPGSAIKPGTVVTAYSKDMAGNVSDLNSAEVEAVDANNPAAGVKVKSVTSTSNANKSTKKAKQLPNTGEKATSATSLGLAVLGMGLALFAAKRKKTKKKLKISHSSKSF